MCKYCRFEVFKVIAIGFLAMTSVLVLLGIAINGLSFGAVLFIILIFAIFVGIFHFRRLLERKCVKNKCRCGCHAIVGCVGRCHYWCATKQNPDLESSEKNKEEPNCVECFFSHKAMEDVSYPWQCECECHHPKPKKKYQFQCSCHLWCRNKY